mmetsp:Transcript_6702/g.12094  ORF Transcript_6702/g.12094 Transcript_6702/m.12094 type:complete len:232 (-) Transcript_6702:3933-4628(-)
MTALTTASIATKASTAELERLAPTALLTPHTLLLAPPHAHRTPPTPALLARPIRRMGRPKMPASIALLHDSARQGAALTTKALVLALLASTVRRGALLNHVLPVDTAPLAALLTRALVPVPRAITVLLAAPLTKAPGPALRASTHSLARVLALSVPPARTTPTQEPPPTFTTRSTTVPSAPPARTFLTMLPQPPHMHLLPCAPCALMALTCQTRQQTLRSMTLRKIVNCVT